jgi:hypothetical protein
LLLLRNNPLESLAFPAARLKIDVQSFEPTVTRSFQVDSVQLPYGLKFEGFRT